MKPIRVLLLTDNFLPSLGGVEQHTSNLSFYLKRLGFDIYIMTSPTKSPAEDAKIDFKMAKNHGVEVSRELSEGMSLPIFNTLKHILNCIRIVRWMNKHGNEYDIIHYHGTRQLMMKFTKTKTPMITTIHGVFPACVLMSSNSCKKHSAARCTMCAIKTSREHIFTMPATLLYYLSYYRLMKDSLSSFRKVICVSEYVETFVKMGLTISNLTTIHNFIDIENGLKPALQAQHGFDVRAYFGVPHEAKLVTYFGRLSAEKGVDTLISAFNEVQSTIPNTFLIIGGSGEQRAQLETLAKGTKNILFVGAHPRAIQLEILRQSDVFVHPANYPDACPTVIIEAMALGVPIVATNIGGIPELVTDGVNGFLVFPNDPAGLAERIFVLLKNEKLRIQFSNHSQQNAREFDILHIGPKITGIYEEAVNKGQYHGRA